MKGMMLCLMTIGWPVLVLAHPQHQSTAEIVLNAQRGMLEISLRVWPDQLREALQASRCGSKAHAAERQIMCYVQAHMHVMEGEQALPLRWVGQEMDDGVLWIYVETTWPKKDLRILNRMFFDVADDQINVVQLKQDALKRTVIQTRQGPSLVVG